MLPEHIDGDLERECFGGALLTSWDTALKPAEMASIKDLVPRTPTERLTQLHNLRARRECFQRLLMNSGTEFTGSSLSHSAVQWMASNEDYVAQQSALAGLIDNLHGVHHEALAAALPAGEAAAQGLQDKKKWDVVRDKMHEFLRAYADIQVEFPMDVKILAMPDRMRRRDLDAMTQMGYNAEEV